MTNPEDELGVYPTLDDVPEEHRLRNFEESFKERDAFDDFLFAVVLPDVGTVEWAKRIERARNNWITHMNDRGRHHALATPNDAASWADALLDEFSERGAHDRWKRVEAFYDWMMWHTDFPHTYNPFIMAAADHEPSRRLWGLRR